MHSPEQVEQIAASIQQFGFVNPVLIDQAGVIVAGHGRYAAAQLIGMAEVPVIVLGHLTEAQRRAYVIADNKIAINATWDMAKLAQEVNALAALEFDLSSIGFNERELDTLLDAEPIVIDMPRSTATQEAPKDDPQAEEEEENEINLSDTVETTNDVEKQEQKTYCCPVCYHEWNGSPR